MAVFRAAQTRPPDYWVGRSTGLFVLASMLAPGLLGFLTLGTVLL